MSGEGLAAREGIFTPQKLFGKPPLQGVAKRPCGVELNAGGIQDPQGDRGPGQLLLLLRSNSPSSRSETVEIAEAISLDL